jgi:hypothetical protein
MDKKCDEVRPVCNRCSRTGLDGCEYRDRCQLAWRGQTSIATEPANKTWRKRVKGKAPADDSAGRWAAEDGSSTAKSGSSIADQVNLCLEAFESLITILLSQTASER